MRLAVTQRVDVVPAYGERRDCLDQRWGVLLEAHGLDIVPVPNGLRDAARWAARQEVGGLLLTGGNDLAHLPDVTNPAPERDATEASLLDWAAARRLPVLGVCRGMQVMNHHLGGTLSRVHGHVAKRHALRVAAGAPLLAAHAEVNSYHGWGIEMAGVAPDLVALAWSEDGSVEACRHRSLPWIGVMWHPEREAPASEADARLIHEVFFNPEGGPP